MKNKKHDNILADYENEKTKLLSKIATKMLKEDEKNQKLKEKIINIDFLKLF